MGTSEGKVKFWVNRGENRGLHSLIEADNRDLISVETVSLSDMISRYSPTLIKVDIEGGEYLLEQTLADLPAQVRGLAIEFHFQREEWRTENAFKLTESFESQGFSEVLAPKLQGHHLMTLGIWRR